MANSLCFTPLTCVKPLKRPHSLVWKMFLVQNCTNSYVVRFCACALTGLINPDSTAREVLRISDSTRNSNTTSFQSFVVRATRNNIQNMKSNSIVCPDCEGNGAVVCSQCKGDGVNSVDHFNGRFKAGGLCWLCRGKKDILCGNCNGAGFVRGFMSNSDS